MSGAAEPSALRAHCARYLTRRVLLVWTLLTVVISAYVYASVAHLGALTPGLGPVLGLTITPLSIGVVGLVLGGGALAAWARRPVYAFGATVLVGIAALAVHAGCPAIACEGAERFRVFVEWTVLGPAVSASMDPGRCAYICPHTVQLVPLGLGYLLIGESMAA